MMELDEAIKHCKEKAKELSDKAYSQWGKNMTEEQAYDCNECAREHEQLAEWLTDYKRLKALENDRPTLRHVIINHPRYGKSDAWYDEARQIVFQHWVSKEYANTLGWKIEEVENEK